MASIPLPALASRDQAPSPIETYASLSQLMGAQQEQQIRAQQIQQGQIQLQDQQAMSAAMREWDGKDPDSLPGLVIKNGGSANAVMGLRNQILDYKTKASQLTSDQIKNLNDTNDIIDGHLDAVKSAPADQKQQAWESATGDLVQKGLLQPGQFPAQYPGDDQLDLIEKQHMGQKAILSQAQSQSETAKNTAQANEATAATATQQANLAKTQAETAWYKQNGGAPGVPAEQQQMADWLSKHPGKGPSDYAIEMKKIVPAFNFNLQNQGAAADVNGNPSQIAQAIANGTMSWKDAVSMRTPMAVKNSILKQVYQINPNFDTAEFGLEQDAAKKARSGAWADTRLAYNTALDHSQLLLQAADALNNGDVKALNALGNRFKTELGWSGAVNYNAIANAYNHEVTSVISKGHLTDKEVETGGATLPSNASPSQIKDVVNSYKALMTSKRDELDKIIKAGAGNKANAVIGTGSSATAGAGAAPAGAGTTHPFFSKFGGTTQNPQNP